jgi:ribonuclease-3
MDAENSLEVVQKIIEYQFSNPKILERALTRFKYLEEKQVCTDDNMDPLATVGDAVLDLVVLARLYNNNGRDVGKLSCDKVSVIEKTKTRALAEKMGFERFVRWGIGEEKDTIWKIADDTFDRCIEALIGAVYLDAQKCGRNGVLVVDDMLVRLGFSLP